MKVNQLVAAATTKITTTKQTHTQFPITREEHPDICENKKKTSTNIFMYAPK